MQGLTRVWKEPSGNSTENALVSRILTARGIISAEEHRSFLDPKLSTLEDPSELPGAEKAGAILWEYLRAGKKVLIYGD